MAKDKYQTQVSTPYIEFTATKKKKVVKGSIHLIYVVLPSGRDGYRLELENEDIGTIIYDDLKKEWRLINW